MAATNDSDGGKIEHFSKRGPPPWYIIGDFVTWNFWHLFCHLRKPLKGWNGAWTCRKMIQAEEQACAHRVAYLAKSCPPNATCFTPTCPSHTPHQTPLPWPPEKSNDPDDPRNIAFAPRGLRQVNAPSEQCPRRSMHDMHLENLHGAEATEPQESLIERAQFPAWELVRSATGTSALAAHPHSLALPQHGRSATAIPGSDGHADTMPLLPIAAAGASSNQLVSVIVLSWAIATAVALSW